MQQEGWAKASLKMEGPAQRRPTTSSERAHPQLRGRALSSDPKTCCGLELCALCGDLSTGCGLGIGVASRLGLGGVTRLAWCDELV
eukprot:366464-Chlamydomonas_euryale.AAC.9